jgi:hypothetical protein
MVRQVGGDAGDLRAAAQTLARVDGALASVSGALASVVSDAMAAVAAPDLAQGLECFAAAWGGELRADGAAIETVAATLLQVAGQLDVAGGR